MIKRGVGMSFEYGDMQRFYAWFDKNPTLGCLLVIGTIVAFAILITLSKRFDKREERRKQKKRG